MKHVYALVTSLVIVLLSNLHAQMISKFDWNSDPVTQSQFGPDAMSVSGSAVSSPDGVEETNGLNAGLPKADIELALPSSAFSNIVGIDFRIDFQRDETRGDFITCGNSFAFGMSEGELFIKFEIDDNPGGTQLIEVNNIYALPDDDIFRTYRFFYLPNSGYAEILVDGTVVWDYYLGNPSNLAWSNNNNVIIGHLMDGNGLDKTIFDNMIIGEVYDSALPVEMSSFEVSRISDMVAVKWKTESELNNDYFTIERSRNGEEFHKLVNIEGAGTTNEQQSYSYDDKEPIAGVSYYRIVQTDFDGKSTTSDILSVQFESEESIFIFPNLLDPQGELQIKLPFVGEETQVVFINERGAKVLDKKFDNQNHLKLNVPSSSGTYIVQVDIDGKMYGTQKIIVR